MAKPGPRPTPTAKKKLHGNPGRRPLPENEPEPRMEDGIPEAADHLDELGKKEWDRMAAELYPTGVMSVVDRTALEAYCSEYSKWVFASGQIQKHGMLIKAQSGFPMQSPYLQIANKSQAEMRKWLCELGCTPSSRTRVSRVQKDEKKDPLQEFQDKGGRIGLVKKGGGK